MTSHIVHCKVAKLKPNPEISYVGRTFQEKVKSDEEGAIADFEKEESKKILHEYLKIAINHRKNDVIVKLLNNLLERIKRPEIQSETLDEVDFGHSDGKKCCEKSQLRLAVLNATSNNDPETLRCLVKWAEKQGQVEKEPCQCAMLIASIEDYRECISLLYKLNYRVRLPRKYEEKIREVFDNDLNIFFMSLEAGIKDVSFKKIPVAQGQTEIKMENDDDDDDDYENLLQIEEKHEANVSEDIYNNVEKDVDDEVQSFLSLKAFSNPNYLIAEFNSQIAGSGNPSFWISEEALNLWKVDPLTKSLVIARVTELLSITDQYDPFCHDYLDIMKRGDKFATDILDNCDNMTDVETILSHTLNKDKRANSPTSFYNETWNVALWNNHKTFVSHPFYQHFFWTKIRGENFLWKTNRLYWAILSVLIFFTYPFIIFIDTVFRNNDLLFESPVPKLNNPGKEANSKLMVSMASKVDAFWGFYRRMMHRPILRIIVHHFLELVFLISVFLSTIDPLDKINQKDFWFYDIILCIFIFTYLIDDIVDCFRRGWSNLTSFWHVYSLVTFLLFAVGQIMVSVSFGMLTPDSSDDRSSLSGNSPVNIGATIFSVAATLALLRPLRWFLFFRSMGPAVVCIIKVMRDALQVFAMYLIILCAFSIGLFSMFKPFDINDGVASNYTMRQADLVSRNGLAGALFWRLFDPGQPEVATVVKCDPEAESCDSEDLLEDIDHVSLEFSHLLGQAMWAAYQGIAVILLINILIAMMNTTYTRVWEQADKEWKYSKTFYQVEFLEARAILPPPFRIFYYFAEFVRWIKRKCSCCKKVSNDDDFQNVERNENKNYMETLQRLIKSKLQTDFERTAQDDFEDLRLDLQNFIKEKFEKLEEDIKNLQPKKMPLSSRLSINHGKQDYLHNIHNH